MKSRNIKQAPISKKATRNPKAVDPGAEQEVKSRHAQGEMAAARRNESVAASAGQKRIQGHQAASTRRRQTRRDGKSG